MKHKTLEDEEQILKNISNGNSQAFRILYMHYYDRLFQFAMMFLTSEAASEDIVEDVFFMLWRDRDSLPSITNFQSYIYQSVRNGCLNVLKSSHVSKRDCTLLTEIQLPASDDSPFDQLVYKELNSSIQQAVNALPERCHIIFKMAKEDEMSHREIAEILNIKECTVARQLLLAKEKLKQAIKPFFEE